MGQSRPSPTEFEAAGLYDPAAEDASQRLAFLEYLIGLGATIEDLLAAPPGDLALVASNIALWGSRQRLTIDEVAVRGGVDRQLIAKLWRAAGFPDPSLSPDLRVLSERDVELFTLAPGAIAFLGEDLTVQLLRVLGAAAARVAEASVSAFVVNIGPKAIEQDPSGLALARANTESLAFLDDLAQAFDTLLRHHIELSFRPNEVMGALSEVDLVRRSVGFADLVDSTAWTQRLDLRGLSLALTQFDAVVSELVVGHGGRVVKLMGDEVMFISNDPVTAVDTALALIESFSSHPVLPPLRAGVASGEVLARDGDYSGVIVNLAARAVKIAPRSTLLVDATTRDALRDSSDFAFGAGQAHLLKGFAEPVSLFEIMRARRRRPRPMPFNDSC